MNKLISEMENRIMELNAFISAEENQGYRLSLEIADDEKVKLEKALQSLKSKENEKS